MPSQPKHESFYFMKWRRYSYTGLISKTFFVSAYETMNGGDPNRHVFFKRSSVRSSLLRAVRGSCGGYVVLTSPQFRADVPFGYRHVILHEQPAAGIAVHWFNTMQGRTPLVGAYALYIICVHVEGKLTNNDTNTHTTMGRTAQVCERFWTF